MFKSKLLYRIFLSFLVFSVLMILPLLLSLDKELKDMLAVGKGLPEGIRLTYDILWQRLFDHLIVLSFYAFFVAFIISLFFSRKILRPITRLKKAAERVRQGNLDFELPLEGDDEINEVIDTFNEMIKTLRQRTEELKKKDIYINAMMDPLWVVDDSNTIIDINPAFTEVFGYRREEVIGTSIYDYFNEMDAEVVRREIETKRAYGKHSTYQVEFLTRDGTPVPVLITGSPIIENGEVTGKIGIIKDISQQARLMRELSDSKEHLESIMDSIQDSMLIIDRNYKVIKANDIARKRYGLDIIGKDCFEVSHKSSRPCWMEGEECPLQGVFTSAEVLSSVHEHYDEEGNKCYEEILASPIRNSEGEVIEVLELMRDITMRVRYEEEIERRNRELLMINSIASIVNRSLRADEVFSDVLEKLIDTFDMDGGGFFILDEQTRMLNCLYHRGVSEEFVREAGRVKLGEDIPGRVAITGEIVTTPDVSIDRRVERSILKHSGIKGYCCIPVKGKERILGVFCLFRYREHRFTPDEENILRATGEMTGLALENIRLYERLRKMFETQKNRRGFEQGILLRFSNILSSANDIEEIISQSMGVIKEFLNADVMMFWQLEDDNTLTLKNASFDFDSISIPVTLLTPEIHSIDSGEIIVVEDIREDSRYHFPEMLKEQGLTSIIVIPLRVGNHVLGVITTGYRFRHKEDEDELHFLRIIAGIFAVAYERSLIYEKRILEKGLADAILNTITEGVCTVDMTERIILSNRSTEKILGIPLNSIIGRQYREIFSRFEGYCPVEKALNGERSSGELRIVKDGEQRVINVEALPLIDADGEVYGAVQVLRDITREKEIDRMKTDIIRSVSHEFRTPLSAIVGLTEMLIDGDVSDERAMKYLKTIYDEGLRLSDMVSDLLNISRIESGKERLKFTEIDFREIIDHLRKAFAEEIERKDITFDSIIEGDIGSVYADRDKIIQVLSNLTDNSIKYSNSGCRIAVRVYAEDNHVIIEHTDTGWGIPEKDLQHIGERFYRGKHGEKTKGTGLGLTLSKEIINLHGGTMQINSKFGVGTSVIITLPKGRYELTEPIIPGGLNAKGNGD